MNPESETPQPLLWNMQPLERLSTIYLLRLYQEAARTQRPLRLILKERGNLAAALDVEEDAISGDKPADLAPRIARRLADLEQGGDPLDCTVGRGVLEFGRGFGLSPAECRVLLLAVVAGSDGYLDDQMPSGTAAAGHDLEYIVAVATGLELPAARAALAPQSLLLRSGLIHRFDRYYEFSERLELIDGMAAAFAEGEEGSAFEQRWLARAPDASLRPDDVDHLRTELETAIAVIKGALIHGGRGVQILLHGEPGVGKTQMARLIAAQAGATAYLLPDARNNGAPLGADQRLRRYAFMQRLLAQQGRSLIILDEVEDMLASTAQLGWAQPGAKPSSPLKAWKNRLLEASEVPGIWIANWIHAIDPALLRRFTLVLRVPNPPARVRIAMLSRYGSGYAEDPQVRSIVGGRDDISPADIERAHAAAQLTAGHCEGSAPARFLRALAMRAAGENDPIVANRRAAPALPYRIQWLNTDPPLSEIVPLLAEAGAARLCFWGAPGTGKTALAQHLAEQLGRPLHVKKASDLISCWLGQTERNIADAFAAARRDDAFLLIDEADSFLRSREGATRSHEVSEVNQILKELENYDGLVALCTNFFETLDTAVLRRLDLKVRFSRLRADAAHQAFLEAAGVLGADADEARAVADAAPLLNDAYALGDIAVAMRQTRLRARVPGAALLRSCLEAERRTRGVREGRPIGFAG